MEIRSTIQIEYNDSKSADISFQSLEVENKGYVKSKIDDSILSFEINSNSLSTFLATVDDLIFSEILVEKVLESTSSS